MLGEVFSLVHTLSLDCSLCSFHVFTHGSIVLHRHLGLLKPFLTEYVSTAMPQ